MTPYLLCLALFCVGLYGVLCKRNLIKMILGVIIMEYAVNLFFVLAAYRTGGHPPIRVEGAAALPMSDPLPHALVLTSIVIGLATTALLVTMAVRLREQYGGTDAADIQELKG